MKAFIRHIIITVLAFVLVATFALIAYNIPFMGPIAEAIKEFEMTDVYCQILQDTNGDDEEVSDDITIVDMSELYTRRDLAKALQDIESQQPKVIGVDVVFEGLKEDSIGDEMIAEVASVNEGFTNMPRNLYGGIKRKLSLGERAEGKTVPSFITMTAAMYHDKKTDAVTQSQVNINFIPRRYRVVQPDSITLHPEWIKGKLVLFGAMKDEYDMHYTPLGKMAGVELLAYSIETLLQKSEIKEVSGWLMAVIAFLLVLLTQVVFGAYMQFAKKRKNRVLRFLMSASFMRGYLMFFWIAVWMWVAFILFYQFDIALNMGWALSAMAFLVLAQSIYDEFIVALKDKKDGQ